ncbi:zinc ribbon domain-containing protein [Collinsella tanakaei]|mgnify:FL=1|uniref:zinc ribbon domain-containing protein n=1 Tax=Collinsella tanakaei TaxID=626935 RepID=UPI002659DD35|nr:zinc ribbon domain-containing protein [Collinsella tanakaei]
MILLKDTLAQLRRERGLTQEELASRLYITRQAVSRWETGATEPGIDMIKLIARELEVPVMRLLDMPEHYCQSCGMMFTGPDQHGHEADGTETEDFCRWCYDQGAYTYETTMEEMIEDCAPRMAEHMGWSVDECASLLGAVLPNLRRWNATDK